MIRIMMHDAWNCCKFIDPLQHCLRYGLINSTVVRTYNLCSKITIDPTTTVLNLVLSLLVQVSFGMRTRRVPTFQNSTWDHGPGGTTTQARLTLLHAWSDAYETSHGRSSHLGEVLAARSSVSQPFSSRFSAVSEPFLGRKWWKIGFLGCRKTIFGASRLKTSPSYVQTD